MTYLLNKNTDDILNSVSSLFTPRGLRCDIEDTKEQYILTMEVPGVCRDGIDLSFCDDTLTISVNKNKCNSYKDDVKFLVRERIISDVKRSFYLENSDEDSIKATLNEGLLVVTIKKKEHCRCRRNVEIE